MNPRSGGGKVERFHLVQEARRRGIEPVVLGPGDDLRRLAEQAVAGAAPTCSAGGDGSQALVAGVAAAHDVAFVCVPAGTRNHLAMDLGLDRDDVVGALEAFGAAVERRIDLAWSATGCSSTTPPWACTPRSCSPRPTATTRSTPPWSCCQSRWARPPARWTWGSPPRRHRAPIRPSHLGLQQPLRAEPPGGLRVQAAPGRRDPWHRRGTAAGPRRGRQVRPAQASGPTRPAGWLEDRHQLPGAIGQPVEVGVDGEAMAAGPTDPVPDRPGLPAIHPAAQGPLRAGNPGWATHLLLADGHRPAGDHRAVIRIARSFPQQVGDHRCQATATSQRHERTSEPAWTRATEPRGRPRKDHDA